MSRPPISRRQRIERLIFGAIGAAAILIGIGFAACVMGFCKTPAPTISDAAYTDGDVAASCAVARGEAGSQVIEEQGLTIEVRAPANYIATRQHPLIMVYAPAGFGPNGSERFADGLTTQATQEGYVVAYVGHVAMTTPNLRKLGDAHKLIVDRWCIDPSRIFDLGHSDGGSVAAGVRLVAPTSFKASASVVSAAGIRTVDLNQYVCPRPRPIMIVHSKNDDLFPGFGQAAASWWASCHHCRPVQAPPRADGCRVFSGCARGAETLWCETDGAHTEWPALTPSMLGFFGDVAGQ